MTSTVQIPASVTPGRTVGYGTGPVEPTAATALTAAAANRKVKALTAEQRATFAALADHAEVDVVALTDAIVAGLGASATRLGQSMARRYQRDLLLGAWGWLQAGAPIPAQPISYTTGATVVVTVHPDGTVTVETDLSEITDRHAAEEVAETYTPEGYVIDVDSLFAAVDAATARVGNSVTVTL